ncbi:TolC family outer membrane protein [Modicisalibacter xianhensis]|uniref:Outer membrane protein, adhesin transport system n=1 Tax=Modicisalibacter xianhensis TaxID=442341 RepID=A0A1I3C0L8_9GAMM|nr:TolC family outer membrane protein [Halomonas xianhensis]SFH68077.1 outer membrane protein, adhesin transport system [Halomonas xianhensis]
MQVLTSRRASARRTPYRALIVSALLSPLALACAQANAQEAAGIDTLRGAVQRAMTQNPQVQASWHGFQAAMDEVDIARGQYLPSLDVSAGMGREYREDDDRGSYDADFAEVTLTQMLWDGFETANEVERLDQAKLVSYYELMSTSNDVALEVTQAYQDVLRYRDLVMLARDNYAKHLEVYRQIEQRTQSGAGRGVDLEQISGRLALAESNLLTEAANLHDVSARFQRLVGELPPDELAPAPEFTQGLPASISDAVMQAYEGNPGFHAAIKNIDAARAAAEATKAGFHPQVDFRASAGTNNQSGVTGRYDQGVVQVVASMNLYRGGSDLAAYRQASDLLAQAKDLRDQECRDVRENTTVAFNDTRRIAEQMNYLNQHRLSTGRVRGAYQQQFDIGERTLLDVLDSENEYFEASRAYSNATYDLEMARARTLAALGQLLPALEVSRSGIPTLTELGSDGVVIDGETICPVQAPTRYSLEELTAGLMPSAVAVPSTASEPVRAPDYVLGADALFETGSAWLSADARDTLAKLAQEIQARSDLQRIVIAGHADSTGSDAVNDPLSEERARRVAGYLAEQGVDLALLTSRGYGSRQPVASNDTVEGRRANRRVEITLARQGE